jgi:cell division protein FtsW (lipid II flippase)
MMKNIKFGFYILLFVNFFSIGLTRYLSFPFGLLIDSLLILIFVVAFIQKFKSISWEPLKNPVFLMVCGWMVFNIFELANPSSNSMEAWFYAMRGVSLYFFLTLLIAYLCLEFKKDFNWFITLWFIFSLIGTLWGLKQLYIGLDLGEKAWLNIPGNLSTHMLAGKLRVFSFYSDAGQFGASQAHTALIAGILTSNEKLRKRKLFYFIVFLVSVYGMLISGTRGAISIPLIGIFTYLLLARNAKVIISCLTILISIFIFLKFTFIGQGNYEIGRLRSSLNPNDASFQVRIENQKKLIGYLNNHWMGGGVGSGGYWGQRFSPNSFLSNLALDSWYVRIAAEYGYVGLAIYIIMMIMILYFALKRIKAEKDLFYKQKLMALFSGLSGILVASYGNQVFGQMPTCIIIYLSIVFLTQRKHAITL